MLTLHPSRKKEPMRIFSTLLFGSLLVACASTPPPAPVAPAATATSASSSARVDGAAAHQLVHDGAMLVDVRTPEEYAAKHIDGAINVPVDDIAAHDFGGKDKPIVLYCMHGQRSDHAGEILKSSGYTNVHVLGPMSAWDQP
jgi:phage shock protein E